MLKKEHGVASDHPQQSPWYKQGLSFKCTECSKCCKGSSGYIWISEQEMQKAAEYLNLSFDDFCRQYIRKVGSRYSLIDLPKEDYRCVFLEGKQCKIYPVRPIQCQTYPYWPSILKSKKNWDQEAKACEGINTCDSKTSFEAIQTQKKRYEAEHQEC